MLKPNYQAALLSKSRSQIKRRHRNLCEDSRPAAYCCHLPAANITPRLNYDCPSHPETTIIPENVPYLLLDSILKKESLHHFQIFVMLWSQENGVCQHLTKKEFPGNDVDLSGGLVVQYFCNCAKCTQQQIDLN